MTQRFAIVCVCWPHNYYSLFTWRCRKTPVTSLYWLTETYVSSGLWGLLQALSSVTLSKSNPKREAAFAVVAPRLWNSRYTVYWHQIHQQRGLLHRLAFLTDVVVVFYCCIGCCVGAGYGHTYTWTDRGAGGSRSASCGLQHWWILTSKVTASTTVL